MGWKERDKQALVISVCPGQQSLGSEQWTGLDADGWAGLTLHCCTHSVMVPFFSFEKTKEATFTREGKNASKNINRKQHIFLSLSIFVY